MRPSVAFVSALSACLLAGGASLAKTPGVDDLLSGEIPALPRLDLQPERVDATERVEGLAVTIEPRIGGGTLLVVGERNRCLRGMSEDDRALAGAADRAFVTSTTLVSPVRAERVVVLADGDASLEITDAWVDPRTLGARQIATHTLPLRKLADAPGDVHVYGVNVGEGVQIIVTAPGGSSFRDGEGAIASTSCGHARIALAAARGAGEQAMFQLVVTGKELDSPNVERSDGVLLPLRVTASLSQVASDPVPLLSVRITRLPPEKMAPAQGPRPFVPPMRADFEE